MQRSHKLVLGFSHRGADDVPVSDMMDTVKYALQHGIDEIDCAPHYGNGMCESMLGIARLGLSRELQTKLKISTKVGRVIDPNRETKEDRGFINTSTLEQFFDYSDRGILSSFYQSQLRLNVKHVHAIYVHDLSLHTHGDKYEKRLHQLLFDGYLAIYRLKKQKKTTIIGIASNDIAACMHMIERDRFKIDRILLSGCYNLLHVDALTSDFFKLCKKNNIEIYMAAPHRGILSEKDKDDKAILDRMAQLQAVCDEFSVPLEHAILQFISCHPQVKRVVVGSRTIDELRTSLTYAATPIESKFWCALKDRNLIPHDASTESVAIATFSKAFLAHFKPAINPDKREGRKEEVIARSKM